MESTPQIEKDAKKKAALRDLLKKRDALPRRLFIVALENLAVFGIPAGVAVYIGIRTGNVIVPLILALAFSWSVFFLRFRAILREAKRIEKEIEAEQLHLQSSKPHDTKEY